MSESFALRILVSFFFIRNAYAVPDSVKLGALLCLSGTCSDDGQSALNGVNLALADLGAKNPFTLITEDSQEQNSVGFAVRAYSALKSKEASIIIGPTWSPAGTALSPLTVRDGILLVSPSLGVSTFTRAGNSVFNARGTDVANTRQMADEIKKRGFKKIAIFSSQMVWEHEQSESFREQAEKIGLTVTDYEQPSEVNGDRRPESLRLLHSGPEAVFFAGFIQMPIEAKLLRELGFKGPFFAAYVDAARIQEAKGFLSGTEWLGFAPLKADFVERYRERYKLEPILPAGIAYDVVMALSKIDLSSSSVASDFGSVNYDGVAGTLHFNSEREAIREPHFYKVDGNGKIERK